MVAYCGWDPTIPVVDETVLLDGDGSTVVTLPCLNVTAVTSVVITDADGGTYTATLTGSYPDVGWSANGVLTWQSGENFGRWPVGQQNIAVTYSGGYNGTPDDLQAALDSVAGRMPLTGASSKALGSAKISYGHAITDGGLLLVEQMVFDKYRLPRVA